MGGFAEYLKLPAGVAIKLPSTLSLADGALIEPMAVGLYGMRQVPIDSNSRILVLGGGSVALAAIWWARRLGAGRIVTASRSARRSEMALAMGADAFVAFGENDGPEIREALGGSPDIVVECIGASGFLAKAVQHVASMGQVLSMGFCTTPDALIPAIAASKGVTMRFPVGYALSDFERVARDLDRGHADPKM